MEEESAAETMHPLLEKQPMVAINWIMVLLAIVSVVLYWFFLAAGPTGNSGQQRRAVGSDHSSIQVGSSSLQGLHEAVLNAFYTLLKGGVIVSCGDKYMIAIEFDGPTGDGGIVGEMTFVDKDPKAQAVVVGRNSRQAKELGENFLSGEEVVYYETEDESVFFALLRKYKSRASTNLLIDIKSGLPLYSVTIAK